MSNFARSKSKFWRIILIIFLLSSAANIIILHPQFNQIQQQIKSHLQKQKLLNILKTLDLSAEQWQIANSLARPITLPLFAPPDTSNQYQNNQAVIDFGKTLFFSSKLSSNQTISCASCHQPNNHWIDTVQFATGLAEGNKNTPSLWNVAYNRWFFWDGRADSLWSQALAPIESPIEMGNNRLAVLHTILNTPTLLTPYKTLFGQDILNIQNLPPSGSPLMANKAPNNHWPTLTNDQRIVVNTLFANIGKAIAAFESTLISPPSEYDEFIDTLNQGSAQITYPHDAIEGFKIFIGKGNCITCHIGELLTSHEFHNIRLPLSGPGRYEGIRKLWRNEFNQKGPYSDDNSAFKLNYLKLVPRNFEEFKVPSLRMVSQTAPYMHDGRFSSLKKVVDYYSELKNAVPNKHLRETIIKPLTLSDTEKKQLIAFLKTL